MASMTLKTHRKNLTLRIAFPYAKPARAYEPARIELAPEYIFLENIYSPLVEMSAKGEIFPRRGAVVSVDRQRASPSDPQAT